MKSRGLPSATPSPSASAARVAGDDLQHLVGWFWLLASLRPENGIESITFEALAAGNLDDIVVLRVVEEPNEYWQTKSAVAASEAVTSDWLMAPTRQGGPSILQKFYQTWLRLRSERPLPRLVLATSRPLDHTDPVLQCRDQRGFLGDRLRRATAKSRAGRLRKNWADHVGATEDELCELLDVLEFQNDATETSWRGRIKQVAIGSGVKHDEASILAGCGVVREWMKRSRVERTSADVEKVIADLNLRETGRSGVLLVQALAPADDIDATVALNWVERFRGDTPSSRRGLLQLSDWNAVLLPELARASREMRAQYSSVLVRGDMRLPSWFAVGTAFRQVAGFAVSTDYRGEVWDSEIRPGAALPELVALDHREHGDGSDFAIALCISYDITPDVLGYLSSIGSVGSFDVVTLAGGPGPAAVGDARDGAAVAVAVRNLIRSIARSHRGGRLHLFLSAPAALCLLLGHFWDHMPPTQLYEDLAGGEYEVAFFISD